MEILQQFTKPKYESRNIFLDDRNLKTKKLQNKKVSPNIYNFLQRNTIIIKIELQNIGLRKDLQQMF